MKSTEELVEVAESRTSEILESTGTRPPGTNKPKKSLYMQENQFWLNC